MRRAEPTRLDCETLGSSSGAHQFRQAAERVQPVFRPGCLPTFASQGLLLPDFTFGGFMLKRLPLLSLLALTFFAYNSFAQEQAQKPEKEGQPKQTLPAGKKPPK